MMRTVNSQSHAGKQDGGWTQKTPEKILGHAPKNLLRLLCLFVANPRKFSFIASMRITGGKCSGRILKVPKGFDVRPTPDLVKQAVFNSLGERVVNARVLELFAGTGALSLESLSRGAARAVCVEKAQRHAQAIRDNLAAAALDLKSLEIRVQDGFVALAQLASRGEQFDLVLADPPYGEKNVGKRSRSLAQKLLDDAHLPALLATGGLFVLGHTKRDTLEIPAAWHEVKVLKHGDSIMRVLNAASPVPTRPTPP